MRSTPLPPTEPNPDADLDSLWWPAHPYTPSHADDRLSEGYRLPPTSPRPVPPMTPFGHALFNAVMAFISRAYGDTK